MLIYRVNNNIVLASLPGLTRIREMNIDVAVTPTDENEIMQMVQVTCVKE